VFINDDERGLRADEGLRASPSGLEDVRSKLRQVRYELISRYRHNRTGEDNGDAHLKRQVMGREVVVAITRSHSPGKSLDGDIIRKNSTASRL